MKKIEVLSLSVLAAFSSAGCHTGAAGKITQEELVRRSQELFDAVAPGDSTPFEKYFARDALFFDEKGRAMDKTALLRDISPMPAGYSGSIRLVRPQSRILGNTALLSYDLDETETVFGQKMTARYHETDTWMNRDGEWQIVAGQVLRYYEDPAAGIPDVRRFPDYAGTYELTPEKSLKVFAENDQLYLQKAAKEKEPLTIEAADIFFRKGVEGRIVFRRGARGQIDALLDRRNNEDIAWKKRAR